MMEQNFQTSFIPKKPIIEERTAPVQSIGFFTVISIFILFTVLIATGGLYFYKNSLVTKIADMGSQLELAKGSFEPDKIAELKLLGRRLSSASDILSHHIVVTPIFKALSAITMKSVRFTKFSYELGTEKDAKIDVKISGQAASYGAYDAYASLALQSDLFGTKDEGKHFINPVFSNLSLDDKGNVIFDLEFFVDPSFVDYKQNLLTQS